MHFIWELKPALDTCPKENTSDFFIVYSEHVIGSVQLIMRKDSSSLLDVVLAQEFFWSSWRKMDLISPVVNIQMFSPAAPFYFMLELPSLSSL